MIHKLHQLVWGPWLLALFLAIGIIYTIKSRFFQIRKWGMWWKCTVGTIGKSDGKKKSGEVTQFQSACTALAATIGTGNIIGVATALTAGGAGAIFWMWISALIGMMTAYAETMLGIKYRYRDKEGKWLCGPMVYLDKGLGLKWLGLLYGFFCILSSFGMGSMVQSNSIAETLEYSFHASPIVVGGFVTALVSLVVWGGIGRISQVSEKMVPFSAGIYIIFSLTIIMSLYDRIPGVLAEIWKSAWEPSALAGGGIGYLVSKSMRYGISRGVFSNEAGLGSMAILHGPAENTTPQQQGMWAMFEVFFDTILICTLTALVILCVEAGPITHHDYGGAALTTYCFGTILGSAGEYLVALAMVLFAFATIIAWFYLGRQAVDYVFNHIGFLSKREVTIKNGYTILYLFAVFMGCITKLEIVWEISDIWNGLMAVPNIIALLFLIREVEFPK